MFLLLGEPHDPCCLSVRSMLEAQNFPTLITANPFDHPSRLSWRLNNTESYSFFSADEESAIFDKQISGVFVRSAGWIDPTGWQPDDLAYMQTEIQAALLAWLWSLSCPVVNRFPSAIWYRSQAPLLSWERLLRNCSLPTLETMITNVEQEARNFGQRLSREGVAGVVYGQLTSDARYIITGSEEWSGLAAIQRSAPVCLTYPHGAVQFVCVVGDRVVWEGIPSSEVALYEQALCRFAGMVGLSFVELAFAPTSIGFSVIAVEPYPHLEHFGEKARREIVEGIVHLLTTGEDTTSKNMTHAFHRSDI